MLFDLHNDIMTAELSLAEKRRVIGAAAEQLDGLVTVYWTTRMEGFPKKLSIRKRRNVFCAIEDMWFYQTADFEELKEFDPLYCSLTWNGDNPLAGGTGGSSGLTENGKRAIDDLNALDIPVDTAHLNRASFFDVADRAARVLNSHCCLDELQAHERNLTDEQIRLITGRGGIVGLTLVPKFISKANTDINDYFMHIDRFVARYGIDYVAVGTDFYGTPDLPTGLKTYHDFYALEYTLLNAGYKRKDINKLFFQNAHRFFGLDKMKGKKGATGK